jgi:pyrroline-5-carboxylate reductase
MRTKNLGFIGGGRIARILLKAFENKLLKFDYIIAYDIHHEITDSLKNQFPEIEKAHSPELPAKQDVVILAVHPPVMMDTLQSIKNAVSENTIIISLAPKITIDKMMSVLSTSKIVRMIPNATTYINEGYNPVSFHESFSKDEKKELYTIFETLGETVEVEERKLESYAIISAMLPTYFWFQWAKMEEIGIKTGLSREESRQILFETLRKSLLLFYESGLSYEAIIDLIPVKPIGDKEEEIKTIYESNLLGLFEKLKP